MAEDKTPFNLARFEELLGGKIQESLAPVVKGFEERLGKLEEVKPMELNVKGKDIVDDGYLQEIGHDMYKLPGGSVIDVSACWTTVGKGFRRSSGMFTKLGDEAKEFCIKAKEALFGDRGTGEFTTKALDIADVIRAQDDSSAGLFVPQDVRYALLHFAPPGTIVWPRAQVWPMTTDNIQWPKLVQTLTAGSEDFFGNISFTWTEEGRAKTKTKPSFDTLSLRCHEYSAYTEVTDVLLEDAAINMANLLVQLFQGAYWHYTDKIFLNGLGGTRPLGLMNDPGVTVIPRVTANKVQYEDLLNMSGELPPMFDANAVWFMSKQCFNSLRKQKDDNNQPVIQLGQGYNDFGEGVAGYACGYPIVMSDYKTAALGSQGDVVLGDWKHYFIGERSAMKLEMSKHVAFQENRTAFRATGRLGGIPEEPKAFVVLDDTADASKS